MNGRMIHKFLVAAAVLLTAVWGSAQSRFPLSPRVADPYIQKFGDWYYMVGTPCPGDWEMQWVGLWKSRDMVNWSGPLLAFEGDLRDRPMWASEIYHKGDRYYIITTCNTWNPGATFMVESAPAPDGPYSFHSFLPKAGLDPHIFIDTDGKSYLLDSEWIAPLNDDWTAATGGFVGHRENKEGPFMLKSDNRYLRFFARIDDTYFMEMEYTDGSTPYTDSYKYAGNVLTGAFLPGHGCLTVSPDGSELWYAAHVTTGGWDTRALAIDRMQFGRDGMPLPAVRVTEPKPTPSLSSRGNIAEGKLANSSAFKSGHEPHNALSADYSTWWEADMTDTVAPYLEVDLLGEMYLGKIAAWSRKGKQAECRAFLSADRLRWLDADSVAGEAPMRYVRFCEFIDKHPRIARVEILAQPRRVPQWDEPASIMLDPLLEADSTWSFAPFEIARSGAFDVEYSVSSGVRHNQWALYDDGRLIARETVSSTGMPDAYTSVISFDVYLDSGRKHHLRLVPESGDFRIHRLTIHPFKQ